jgi:hypothetical protein
MSKEGVKTKAPEGDSPTLLTILITIICVPVSVQLCGSTYLIAKIGFSGL